MSGSSGKAPVHGNPFLAPYDKWVNGARIEPGIVHLRNRPENRRDNLSQWGLFFRCTSAKKRASHSHSGRVYGPIWSKLFGRIHIDCRGIDGPWVRCKSAVFWQTDQYLTVFSTRTEKEGNTGFFGSVWHPKKRKGAWYGLIFTQVTHAQYQGISGKA